MQLHLAGWIVGAPNCGRGSSRIGLPGARRSRFGWLRAVASVACGFVVTSALAGPASPAPRTTALAAAPTTSAAVSEGGAAPYARHLAALINEYRSYRGLPALELVGDLSALAYEHSSTMAASGRLSHDGFHDRFDRTRARICVENVGMNFPHAEAQLDGWRASPGHHRNLLEPKVQRMGIARTRSFVTFFACS